jgi:hypothetical protein
MGPGRLLERVGAGDAQGQLPGRGQCGQSGQR